jgi:dTDP-4-amino-4,6-dideoxygalactose transaminase
MLAPVVNRHGFASIVEALICSFHDFQDEIIHNYFRFNRISYCSSGKQALYEILLFLKKRSNRNKVIVQSYTCYSVAKAIVESGLDIHIIDTDPSTLDFNYEQLANAIDKNTLCIIATHLFGTSANIGKIKSLINDDTIYLVEDSAQKQLSSYQESSLADVSIYSFGRGKPISLMGGGIVAINSDELSINYKKHSSDMDVDESVGISFAIKMFINDILTYPGIYGIPARLPFLGIGKTIYPNAIELGRLTKYQKCYLANKLLSLNADYFRRKNIAIEYTKAVTKNNIAGLALYEQNIDYAPHRYPFYASKSIKNFTKDVIKKSKKYGIVSMYPAGIYKLHQIMKLKPIVSGSRGAEYISNHLMTAPTHVYVNKKMLNKIIEIVRIFV